MLIKLSKQLLLLMICIVFAAGCSNTAKSGADASDSKQPTDLWEHLSDKEKKDKR